MSLDLDIRTGAQVAIRFEGDPVPGARVDDLVPIALEGAIDEDLLEDSSLRITTHRRQLGYRDARVTHSRLEEPGQLSVVFTARRGPRYVVDQVAFAGPTVFPETDLAALFDVEAARRLVIDDVRTGAAAGLAAYERRGYRRIEVREGLVEGASRSDDGGPAVVPVRLAIDVVEGAGHDGPRRHVRRRDRLHRGRARRLDDIRSPAWLSTASRTASRFAICQPFSDPF